MNRRPPRDTLTDTRVPYTTLFRSITSQKVQVLAGKKVNVEAVRAGTYEHLGLDASSLKVGHRWELIPAIEVGKTSARNQEGWEIVRDRKSTRLNSSH